MNEKILSIIKKKVDEATPEELEEALKYIEKKLKGFGICTKRRRRGELMAEELRISYKNQKQKDKELMLAYTKGNLDERKVWENVKKENDILKYREEKRKKYCFCAGEKIWRPVCSECQEYRSEILSYAIKNWILANNKRITINDFFMAFGYTFKKDLERVEYDIDKIKFPECVEDVA